MPFVIGDFFTSSMNRQHRLELAPLHQRLCTVENQTPLNPAQIKYFSFFGIPPLCPQILKYTISALSDYHWAGAFDLHSFPLLLSTSAVECVFSLDAGEETD